jgi:hypothetical protein
MITYGWGVYTSVLDLMFYHSLLIVWSSLNEMSIISKKIKKIK